jgi:glycosyltransferase involved in cell wall biosynthesis
MKYLNDMENPGSPLVSCLCLSEKRPEQLWRAINCFLKQTYPNKELIVLFKDNDPETKEALSGIRNRDIRCFEVSSASKMSLGNLRNLAVSKADGEYICQWDDDDWYHERRVEIQLASAITNHKPACYLAYKLMYDMVNNRSYLSAIGPWPGTILCKRSILQGDIRYPDLSRHEDYDMMTKLIGLRYVFPLIMPFLYIYSYHGRNTFGKDHFSSLFAKSQQLPDDITECFRRIFASEISNADATRILMSPEILKNLDYFYETNMV